MWMIGYKDADYKTCQPPINPPETWFNLLQPLAGLYWDVLVCDLLLTFAC